MVANQNMKQITNIHTQNKIVTAAANSQSRMQPLAIYVYTQQYSQVPTPVYDKRCKIFMVDLNLCKPQLQNCVVIKPPLGQTVHILS